MDLFDNRNFVPMLLSETKEPFNDKNFLYELKFDGMRTLIYSKKDNILIKNRNGMILNSKFPELLNIKNKSSKKVIFDGEIVIMENGKPSFKKLQERIMLKDELKIKFCEETCPAEFICFDIIYENKDITELPLIERKKILDKYKDTTYFIKSKFVIEDGIKLFNFAQKEGLEGIVAKKISSKYIINKRSENWIKIKNFLDEDYYIGAYNENTKGTSASIAFGIKTKEGLKYIGNTIIGKNNPDFLLIKEQKTINSSFIDFNDKKYTFINPKLEATITFLERTTSGKLRHPHYKGLKK